MRKRGEEWKFKPRRVEIFYFVSLKEGWTETKGPGPFRGEAFVDIFPLALAQLLGEAFALTALRLRQDKVFSFLVLGLYFSCINVCLPLGHMCACLVFVRELHPIIAGGTGQEVEVFV